MPIDSLELGMIQPIFERLNSRVAISSENAAPVLSNLFDRVVVVTDGLMNALPTGQGPLTSMAAPSDAACVLFVPTSSNDARGITFSHAALSTALIGQGPAVRITPLSRVMQLSSFNVDICITEIFTTLTYGGCVCIPSATERLHDFGAAVNRMQVNWSYMTPLLSRKVDPTLLPSLKVVCFRTRGLDEDTYSIWHGKVNVVLAYGPQDVCPLGIAFLDALGPQHLKSIGRPFAGSLLIVNPEDHKKCVPVGAVGELIVEGPTLGVSYPNRESTISPMSPLGTGAAGNTRYFKTGHRVRYTQGGLMEFISSKRDDVDLDGKAVNITEIEQCLRRCLGQGVDVVVEMVTFRGPAKNDTVLAAFIELGDRLESDNLTPLSAATREQLAMAKQLVEVGLKNRFAPSMIPSVFVPVKHLPITPSLKVNRRRLQRMITGMTKEDLLSLATLPNPSEAKSQHLKPLPLTQSEGRMRAIWARVLGVEDAKISALDSFFSVGGDDIVAAQLVAECRHEGISVSIADLLRNATLTELSRAIAVPESPKISQEQSPDASQTSSSPALADPNTIKEVFIQKVIAPKLGVDGSAIGDAAEASSAQIRYIETGMLSGRTNINYLVFNFSGSVNAKKLEEACRGLIEIHPILRTAFVPYNRRVYQVVIKSIKLEFRRHSCQTWRLANTLEKVIKKDQSTPTNFETPITKFMYLDGGKQSILILRLSKAQYDDLSVALLVKDLKRLYDGSQSPPRRPSYCDFVRCAHLANSQGAEEYWRALLEGAVMTQVVAHTQPYRISTNVKTIRNPILPLGSLSSLGISFETVLKGAWAMVLANLSASSDIVFGELIDGRHIRLPGGQSVAGVMGPTVNITPVRVQFPDTALTPLNLLQYIHAQRMAGIPFENLGTLTIVEKCTPWPYWTRFSTLVQHQYEDTAINPSESKSFHLGTAACKFTITESKAQDVPDLFVRSLVRPPGRVEISITFCADRVPETFAEHTLRMLCSTISLLTSVSIMQPVIPCGYQYRTMAKRIPLPQSSPSQSQASDAAESVMSSLSEEKVKAIQGVIWDTWTSILDPGALGVPEPQIPNAAFFDLWGSLIPASQMMHQLNRELPKINLPGVDGNLKVTMEEIVENPTMLKQFELIASKIKPQAGKETLKGKEKEKDKDKDKEKEKDKDREKEKEKQKEREREKEKEREREKEKGKEKEKDKDKEKDKEKEKEKQTEKSSSNAKPSGHQRRKPSMSVSVPAASLGSRIRRLASTVGRSNSPPTHNNNANNPSNSNSNRNKNNNKAPMSPQHPPPTPTSPVAIGIASAMVAELTQLSPRIIGGIRSPGISSTMSSGSASISSPIPSAPPQLPNLPAFDPIAEEAEPTEPPIPSAPLSAPLPLRGLGITDANVTANNGGTNPSSADSMTEGSSANSHHGRDTPSRADESVDKPSPLPTPGPTGGSGGGGEDPEGLVSPLSAATPKSGARYFGAGHGGGGASVVSSPDTPGRGATDRFGDGKGSVSPNVG